MYILPFLEVIVLEQLIIMVDMISISVLCIYDFKTFLKTL